MMNEDNVLKNGTRVEILKRRNTFDEFTDTPPNEKKANCIQSILAIIANITVLSSGMGLGFPAITLSALTKPDDPLRLSQDEASWFASINAIFCILGGLLMATILDRIGRKFTFIVINILSIISWGIMAFASKTSQKDLFWELMFGRILIGIVTGLSSSPAAIYSAEIANPKLRGRLSLLTSLAIALGALIVYILGYFIPDDWRLVSLIAAISSCVCLVLVFVLPETPAWLVSKGRLDKARKSICFIRSIPLSEMSSNVHVNDEINRISAQISSRSIRSTESVFSMLRKPEVYKPLAIINAFFAFQQFSGLFVVVVYATKFATEANVQIDPFLCTVLIGSARVLATLLVGNVMDSLGRKVPSLFSAVGMTVCMYGLVIYKMVPGLHDSPEVSQWLPATLLISYIFVSTFGFLTVPFAMVPELIPLKIRGFGAGITVSFLYLMSFIAIKLYPSMVETLGNEMVFGFYGTVSFFGIFFVQFILPETKGRTLEEIENSFKPKNYNVETAEEHERL